MRRPKPWKVLGTMLIIAFVALLIYGWRTDTEGTAGYVPNEKAIRL